MTPDEPFKQALSDAANSAAAIVPTTALMRRTLQTLIADAIRLEADSERLVAALRRLQQKPDAG